MKEGFWCMGLQGDIEVSGHIQAYLLVLSWLVTLSMRKFIGLKRNWLLHNMRDKRLK